MLEKVGDFIMSLQFYERCFVGRVSQRFGRFQVRLGEAGWSSARSGGIRSQGEVGCGWHRMRQDQDKKLLKKATEGRLFKFKMGHYSIHSI